MSVSVEISQSIAENYLRIPKISVFTATEGLKYYYIFRKVILFGDTRVIVGKQREMTCGIKEYFT